MSQILHSNKRKLTDAQGRRQLVPTINSACKRLKMHSGVQDFHKLVSDFKKVTPQVLAHFQNKALQGENWETIFTKNEEESTFYGADSQGISIDALLFPREQFVRQAGLSYDEAPEVLAGFKNRPINHNHNGIVIGCVQSIRFDDLGMHGSIYIYPPSVVPQHADYIRNIKAEIMAKKIKQISVSYDVNLVENGKDRIFPTEISVVDNGRLEVGDFIKVAFSSNSSGKKDFLKFYFIFFFLLLLFLFSFLLLLSLSKKVIFFISFISFCFKKENIYSDFN
jgi:hypothetical protein